MAATHLDGGRDVVMPQYSAAKVSLGQTVAMLGHNRPLVVLCGSTTD
jgi:hypothetical protein